MSDETIAHMLKTSKTIAPSYGEMVLLAQGYQVTPVSPKQAGLTLQGQKVYATLADIPHSVDVDMVDVFMVRKLNRPFWGFLTVSCGEEGAYCVRSVA
ncbi:hypothetical protein EWM60_03960 [Candidatus Erwinia dacicola]|uniref:CoA binding domain protein n=1 Tax=Candidatus Erwinia dacicola TaxID=252393 RepID=A0A328TGV2_9GAMM|nr:hypothetical protein [Candidatus Erwinia dacicola]NJD85029.1 hypothetical protein [Candidatus Erwinia dacicola]RAP68501.1 coA binding domain protein [Candidatus Erwinia dacicola]